MPNNALEQQLAIGGRTVLAMDCVLAGAELAPSWGIAHVFGINRPGQPRWKQSTGILVIFVLLTVLIIGPALYKIAHE